ncbi:MAG: hypothetical protein KatS3mg105_1773 [Gemmatales bacterium]|nr:MAG: hypothetical protein KatS3mg105_1773 [Gemmatales bacterium]
MTTEETVAVLGSGELANDQARRPVWENGFLVEEVRRLLDSQQEAVERAFALVQKQVERLHAILANHHECEDAIDGCVKEPSSAETMYDWPTSSRIDRLIQERDEARQEVRRLREKLRGERQQQAFRTEPSQEIWQEHEQIWERRCRHRADERCDVDKLAREVFRLRDKLEAEKAKVKRELQLEKELLEQSAAHLAREKDRLAARERQLDELAEKLENQQRDLDHERQRLEQVQEQLARDSQFLDDLTGLNQRKSFTLLAEKQMEAAKRSDKGLLLFFADLDGLKDINDEFGHPVGDEALKATADILRETLRSSDIIARIGGDEFVALVADAEDPEYISKRLRQKIDEYNAETDRPFRLSISWGAVRYCPERHASLDELVAEADQKMYEQKRRRKPF